MRRPALLFVPALAVLTGGVLAWASGTTANDGAQAAQASVMADVPVVTVAAADTCEVAASQVRDITRVSGTDRYATAVCASGTGYAAGATTVVLARGDAAGDYADALAGTVLAHAVDGPVLLTAPDALPQVTADELVRLGAEHVVLLGGDTAISEQVRAEVESLGVTTERLDGSDRAETAALASARAEATDTVFIVNGHRPADALVAGAVAARAGAGLLLATEDQLPDATRGPLQTVTKVTIVGGYGVVSAAVEETIRDLVPDVTRLSGADRAETAASVARALPADGTVHLVSGRNRNLVDAIAAGWLAAQPGGGAVLYSDADTPGRGTDRYLRLGGLEGAPAIRLVGGEGILGEALVDALEVRYDETEAGGPAAETRAMWVHAFDGSLKSREAIAHTLDTAAAHNLNTVIAQVVRRHDSYSTSDVLPRTSDASMDPELDLLAELTEQGAARGLSIQAWVVVANAWHSAYGSPSDLPEGHIYRTHGPTAPESQRWMTRHQDGTWSSQYLDVGVPAFQDHIVALSQEIAQRYPVDAVHLDYIRYPEGGQYGYNTLARQAWQADGSPDFSDWRRAQTEELTERVKAAVSAARPGTRVTMAAIAQGDGPDGMGGFQNTRAYAHTYQDWAGWLARDVVDAAYPMAYMREDGVSSSCTDFSTCEHAIWYDNWVTFAAELAPHEDIAIGQGSFLNTVGHAMSQLSEALAGTDGVVLYSYQQDTKCPAGKTDTGSPCAPIEPRGSLFDELLAGPFADPAPAP